MDGVVARVALSEPKISIEWLGAVSTAARRIFSCCSVLVTGPLTSTAQSAATGMESTPNVLRPKMKSPRPSPPPERSRRDDRRSSYCVGAFCWDLCGYLHWECSLHPASMTPDPLAPLLERIDQWLKRGFHITDTDVTNVLRDCRLALQQAAEERDR